MILIYAVLGLLIIFITALCVLLIKLLIKLLTNE